MQPQPEQKPASNVVQVIRLSGELKAAIDKYAYERNMSTSDCIRRALADLVGIDPPPHGNAKYATLEARRAAKRKQRAESKRRMTLLRKQLIPGE